MQTLTVDIASTFVDDATALVTGFGRGLLRFAMGPIDRIANACDIAGVLTERRATFRMWRATAAVPVMRAAALACSAASRRFAASPISPEASAAATFGSPRMQYQAARKDLPCLDIRADAAAFDDAVQVSLIARGNILAGAACLDKAATEPLRTKPRHAETNRIGR